MLYVALIGSGFMLLGCNVAARLPKRQVMFAAPWIALPCLLPILVGLVSFTTWQLGIVLFLLVIGTTALGRPRLYLPLSLLAALFVFGFNSWVAWDRIERLREKFPYESLEGRLPVLPSHPDSPSEAPDVTTTAFQHKFDRINRDWRSDNLELLHERATQVFINQQNFGVARMSGLSEWSLKIGLREGQPVPQSGRRSLSSEFLEQVGKPSSADEDLATMHNEGAADFVYPDGFGYFKDRQHIAGFQPHQFSRVPDAGKQWKLEALDLLGLIVHEKPVVYLSENLPRMDELRKAPLRELNAFEAAGLKALRDGKNLFVGEMPDKSVRMLGALRSMDQCIKCHGGGQGDLLGAFSYELRKE
jgi:hypothetical protein